MSSMINTNIASLNAQRNLGASATGLTTSLQRLSSGLRINSAKDDAAGMAISQRMTAQIGGMNQAARNANDAISLSQTAESALSGIGDNLQRLRTLAVQAANVTNSDSDRATIQKEVGSLVTEIGRVAGSTEFNGIKLLDGSFSSQSFQIGANANEKISVSIGGATTDKLGATQAAALTASTNNGVGLTTGDITINGVSVGGSSAAADNASRTGNAASAISKAAAINAVSAQTGVTAKADVNEVSGAAMTAASLTGTLTVNGVATGTIITTTDGATSRAAVIAAINAISGQTGVVAADGGTSAAGIKLSAADGRNIAVTATGTLTSAATGIAGAGAGTVNYGKFTLTSDKAITVTGNDTNLLNAGVKAGTYATQTAYASTAANATGTAFAAGDFKLNGIAIGASSTSSDTSSFTGASGSAIAKSAAINALTSQTGVTATVNTTTLAGTAQSATALTGTLSINGISTASFSTTADATESRAATIAAINAISGQTGVVASDGGTSAAGVKLSAADGRNITVTGNTLTASATGISGASTAGGATTYGTFTLSSAKSFTVAAGTTGATSATTGMLEQGTYGAGRSGQSLATVDVSTAAGASNAISAIDNAIASINNSRADLGAIQNRFASTISTLQATSENLTAAKSRIVDADFAVETANLTRGQILQQAGTAMLAQANGLPNGVLALLRG